MGGPAHAERARGVRGALFSARTGWIAAYAALTFGAFPHPVGARVVDLGLVLAWLAPLPLLLALRGLPPRRAAGVAFLAGLAAHAAVLHWIYVVTVRYGHAPPAVGVVAPLLLASYIALHTAAFGAGAAALARAGRDGPLALAALWTAVEWARSFVLTGFPWATLGYAQHSNPVLLGLAPLAGVYALSFASVLGAATLRELPGALRGGARARRRLATGGVALAAILAVGAASALRPRVESEESVRVAVLQGNIPQGQKWSPEWMERTLRIYEDLTRRAAARGAELVVWPETAVPAPIDTDAALRARLQRLAREAEAAMVVGVVGLEPGPAGGPPRVFDSAAVFGPDGSYRLRYDKTHLVPFGEYLPLRALLGRFVGAIARGSAGVDVSPGPAPRAVPLPLPRPADARDTVTAGVPICYELLFPDLVRRFAGDGARLLLAITNDAWYGHTGAPLQFLAITALRSAETGLWTVRAANTGVSARIDDRGRVRESTWIFERGLLVGEVPLAPRSEGPTLYTRFGDWLPWACVLGLGAMGAVAAARRRTARGTEEDA